jgi:hypothetical protein
MNYEVGEGGENRKNLTAENAWIAKNGKKKTGNLNREIREKEGNFCSCISCISRLKVFWFMAFHNS